MPTAEKSKAPSTATPARKARAESTAVAERSSAGTEVAERVNLPEQLLELAKVGRQTAIETARKLIDTAESVPIVGAGVSLAERIANAEIELLRGIVHTAVGVDVSSVVKVDVLARGLHVDVLAGGVNLNAGGVAVNVLSPQDGGD
jgi:hypothetical protein